MENTKVIIKWEGGKAGDPVLFLPEYSANHGNIVCYAHMGQHSEACVNYYRGLRNPPGNAYASLKVNNLLAEYRGKLEKGETLVIVSRDTAAMRRERWKR